MIELVDAAAHVVVTDLGALALEPSDEHHLARVLRLRAGERASATDGQGSWRWCRWDGHVLEPDGDIAFVARPDPQIAVGFALVKGDRADWIVQKLTELGIDRIAPVGAERCVVRCQGERAAAQVARLRRIAREAVMQSRRVWEPQIDDVAPAATVLAEAGSRRADFDGPWLPETLTLASPLIVVGPEGGWSVTERGLSNPVVRLAEQVLRTETAAIAAGVLLADRRHRARAEGSLDHPS